MCLRAFLRDENGGPAIEFGLVAVFMAFTIPAFFDLAEIISARSRLSNGMSAAVQFAYNNPTDTAGIEEAIEQASGLGTTVEVSVTEFCECGSSSNSCNSACSPSSVPLERYQQITSTYSFTTNYSFFNLYQNPATITRTISLRTQ